MSNVIYRQGFVESVLDSDDDYEPYGYVAARLATVSDAQHAAGKSCGFGPYEREIEAAVLRQIDSYPGC